jgi:hypothetical protein
MCARIAVIAGVDGPQARRCRPPRLLSDIMGIRRREAPFSFEAFESVKTL